MTNDLAPQDERSGVMVGLSGFWLVSLSPVIVAGSNVHGLSMAFWRCGLGLVGVGAFAAARRLINWDHIRRTALAGFFFSFAIGLFFWAAQITSIANASLITVLQPIVLMLAAHYTFSETVTVRDVLWSMVAIAGAIILIVAGDSSGTGDIAGDALAMVSILLGAGYFISGKKVLKTVPVSAFMTGVFFWAGLWLIVIVLVAGIRVTPSEPIDWIRAFGIALFPGVGHLLLNVAQKRAPLHLLGVLQLIIPVNATLMAFWFLGQRVVTLQLVGMALVIGALGIQALMRPPPPEGITA